MDFNQFTTKSQEIISNAQQKTIVSGNQSMENAHILNAIIEVDHNVFPHISKKLGANPSVIAQANESILQSFPKVSGGNMNLSKHAQKTVAESINYSKTMGDDFVSIEHIILGMLKTNDNTSQLLKDNGFNIKDVSSIVDKLRNGSKVTSASQEDTYNALSKYAINLNDSAEEGKLDPVIGRDDEIRRVLQILTRRTKNNPILIGEPGVGKTAIAEVLHIGLLEEMFLKI